MNGLDLLKRLRKDPQLASLVVVMVTTETEMDQMAKALEAGANEYVMKPFTKDILVEKLQLAGCHEPAGFHEEQPGFTKNSPVVTKNSPVVTEGRPWLP